MIDATACTYMQGKVGRQRTSEYNTVGGHNDLRWVSDAQAKTTKKPATKHNARLTIPNNGGSTSSDAAEFFATICVDTVPIVGAGTGTFAAFIASAASESVANPTEGGS